MLYVLIYPVLPDVVAAAVDRFRTRFEPERAELVRPHVTLVFGTQAVGEEAMAVLCRAAAEHRSRFRIGLGSAELVLDPVDGTFKMVLPVTDGCAEILAMQHDLYDGPHRSQLREDTGVGPHMTIGNAPTRAEAEEMRAAALDLPCPCSGVVEAIALARLTAGSLVPLDDFSLSVVTD